MADEEASDRDDASISRVDRMEYRPPKDHQARAQKEGVITALMQRWRITFEPHDCDPTGAIKCIFKRKSNGASGPSINDLTDTTYSKRSMMDRFIVTVDRFDRMVTIKSPI